RLKTSNRNCWARRTSSAFRASRAAYLGRLASGVATDVCALVNMFNCVLQEFDCECCPSGLMTRTTAAAGFAVEIFVKQHEIAPVRIISVFRNVAVARARTVLVRQKDAP